MRKKVVFILVALIIIFSYLTIASATKAFVQLVICLLIFPLPRTLFVSYSLRKSLILHFGIRSAKVLLKQAKEENVQLEVWGSYGNNQDDFLKKMEVAIHSKVNGIIVQGLDNEEFKELTKVKAAFYGIPVITVANDVPVEESLRKTYVGSDQFGAGKMVAHQLIKEMGTTGEVIILGDQEQAHYQKERLAGIQDVLSGLSRHRNDC